MANDLPIHRTKLEKADHLYKEHKGELLAPPTSEHIDQLPELVRHEFSIKEAKTDVVFQGLVGLLYNMRMSLSLHMHQKG